MTSLKLIRASTDKPIIKFHVSYKEDSEELFELIKLLLGECYLERVVTKKGIVYCDEDGRMKELDPNERARKLTEVPFVGDVILIES